MPYAADYAGIYRVVDQTTATCYVGQSRRVKKRIAEHFRLLRHGRHPNHHLQAAYDRAGESAFQAEVEVACEDPKDLDLLEEAFLQGDAKFDLSPTLFNISSTARTPMEGRCHTEETRSRISFAKRGRREHVTPEYRAKLSAVRRAAALADPEFRRKVKFIAENPQLSYAERGRRLGTDTSTVRKLAMKYGSAKETLNG
jgi:group I intron endonuclease